MSKEFPELKFTREPLKIASSEDPHKVIAILFHMYQKGLYINQFHKDENYNLLFSTIYSNTKRSTIRLNNETFNVSVATFKDEFQIIYSLLNDTMFRISATAKLVDLESKKYELSNPNQVINKIKFLEDNIGEIYAIKRLEQAFAERIEKSYSINECYKLKRYIHFLKDEKYLKHNVIHIKRIDYLRNRLILSTPNKDSSIKISSGPIRLERTKQGYVKLSLGGFIAVHTKKFQKYKYMNSPILNITANIVCKTSIYEKLNSNINKLMLKGV